ncbi:hypothetical protein D5b_00012 [Faustovirus]|nr:hypothetical protein D5b_00012 [Faustovirus]AMP43972.1 hypothetical protein PRJ_Dakar_00012 [Faustovirus]
MDSCVLPIEIMSVIAGCDMKVFSATMLCCRALYDELNSVSNLRKVFKAKYRVARWYAPGEFGAWAIYNVLEFNNGICVIYNKHKSMFMVYYAKWCRVKICKFHHMGRGRVLVETEWYDRKSLTVYGLFTSEIFRRRVITPLGTNDDFISAVKRYFVIGNLNPDLFFVYS